MVKHVIIWNFPEGMSETDRILNGQKIKAGLESLKGQIDGLLDIHVYNDMLPTSNGDLMLDSTFEDAESLNAYTVHPAHVRVATEIVRPVTCNRKCVDFELPNN